ncbi:MAG: tetratricopeptide repeat protein, partial [Planctomycetales bacterium]|nr:tetratricopeptide repeat protein [Planctomycetales bacterium]
ETIVRLLRRLAKTIGTLGYSQEAVELLTTAREGIAANDLQSTREAIYVEAVLGLMLLGDYRFDAVIETLEPLLPRLEATFGPNDQEVVAAMVNLATAWEGMGNQDKCLQLRTDAVNRGVAGLDPSDPVLTIARENLATSFIQYGRYQEAHDNLAPLVAELRTRFGENHMQTLIAETALADCEFALGYHDSGLKRQHNVVERMSGRLGASHPDTMTAFSSLANYYWRLGNLEKSIPMYREVVDVWEQKFGRDHPETLTNIANLGVNVFQSGDVPQSIELFEEVYGHEAAEQRHAWVGPFLLQAYVQNGRIHDAEKILDDVVADQRETCPAESLNLASQLATCALALVNSELADRAEPLLVEVLAIRQSQAPDAWSTFNTQSMLGGVLLGRGDHANAEPLLRQGYEGMRRREASIPLQARARLNEAVQRLVALCEATERQTEAEQWKAVLAESDEPNRGKSD